MRATPRLLIVGLAGALGGAINGWLCHADLPVPAYALYASGGFFNGSIVPAGAVHGGVLALSALGLDLLRSRMTPVARLMASIPLGGAAGFFSWILLSLSIFGFPTGRDSDIMFVMGFSLSLLGLVAPCYYLSLACFLPLRHDLSAHLLRGILAGVVGSTWFWLAARNWPLALLHGLIWGSLVGTAAWWVDRRGALAGGDPTR